MVSYGDDSTPWQNIDSIVRRAASEGRKREVWLTISGVVHTSKEPGGRGFGHLGLYPAELEMRSVRDVELTDVARFDYRQLLKPAEAF
jgi:hypothetical protein